MGAEAMGYPEVCGVHAEESDWVPADRRSNLCEACRDQLASSLRMIERYWDEVMDALQRGTGGGGSERMGGSDVHAPLPINAHASDAMRLARDAVWSAVDQLVMDKDAVRLPDDQSTPSLAGWLARWHVEYLAGHPNGSWTVEWYAEIQQAAEGIEKASADGVVEVYTEKPCGHKEYVVKGEGEQRKRQVVKCPGMVTLVQRPGVGQVAVCSVDPVHAVSADVWFKAMKLARPQRRGARPAALSGRRLPGLT